MGGDDVGCVNKPKSHIHGRKLGTKKCIEKHLPHINRIRGCLCVCVCVCGCVCVCVCVGV